MLCAGLWLLTGVYNLRNPPVLAGIEAGRKVYEKREIHAGLSGYVYVVAGFLKGITASMMSWYSHSLGLARWPMIAYGLYDCASLAAALRHVLRGDVAEHRRWMVRNFAVGAGSIWVRIFGAAWAALDLEFMRSTKFYGRMNNLILVTGFTMGPLFGEWWIARSPAERKRWAAVMALNVVATFVGAQLIYKEKREDEVKLKESLGGTRTIVSR